MNDVWIRRLSLWGLMCLFALLGVATSEPAEDDGTDNAADETESGGGSLSTLEGTLRNGEAHGIGPGADVLATSIMEGWGGDDQAIAVQVLPGDPEHIVVVMRDSYLSDYGMNEREETLNAIGVTLDHFGARQSHVAIGLRGRMMFGATAVREPGGTWQLQTGEAVSQAPLDAAMTAEPAAEGVVRRVEYGRLAMDDELYRDECDDDDDSEERWSRRCGEARADRYPVELTEGATITVTMDSPEVDAYLFLLDPDGEIVAFNDDDTANNTLGSRVEHTATTAGTYTVIATSLDSDSVGNYATRIAVRGGAVAAE